MLKQKNSLKKGANSQTSDDWYLGRAKECWELKSSAAMFACWELESGLCKGVNVTMTNLLYLMNTL